MRFKVRAMRDAGAVSVLECEAADIADASRRIEALGYAVLSVKPQAAALLGGRTRKFPLILFSQELLVLLRAGIPLVESLQALCEKERNASARGVIERLLESLRQGWTLSRALEEHADSFPPLYVASMRASERTSGLAEALARYVSYETQLREVRKKIVNASIYPALLISVGGLVCLFLLLYVVPRFSHVYEERGTELPTMSRLLVGWGRLLESQGTLLLGALVALAALALYALRQPAVRYWLGALLWRAPALAERLRTFQIARLYRTTSMLLRGGVPLVRAFEMACGMLHPLLQPGLRRAIAAIREGRPIAAALDKNGLATPVALRMLSVGEQAGNMGEMMERIAEFHDEEISRWVEWFTQLFEPILMALIGLFIGAIVVFMYMPVFELAGSIG